MPRKAYVWKHNSWLKTKHANVERLPSSGKAFHGDLLGSPATLQVELITCGVNAPWGQASPTTRKSLYS